MTDFGGELRRIMASRGLSLRETARRVPCDSGYLSKVAAGRRRPSPELVARLDAILGADGTLQQLALPAPRREPGRVRPVRSSAVEALQVAMTGEADGPDIGGDGLAELVPHYARTVAVAPSAAVYRELLSARSFAGTLLGRCPSRQRPGLKVTAGWLSSLLAVSAADLGDHAAAIIWCTDTERRGREVPRAARLGRADPVADRLVPGRPAALGRGGPARASGRAGRIGSARQAGRARDALPGPCSATPPG